MLGLTLSAAAAAPADDGFVLAYERPVLRYSSCSEASRDERLGADARIVTNFEYSAPQATPAGGWSGTLALRVMSATLTIRQPWWPNMSAADLAAVARSQEALEKHEQGHVAIARRTVHAFNERPVPIETAERADYDRTMQIAGASAVVAIQRRQEAYDLQTDHGRRQHLAEPDLRGPDTTLRCPR